MGKLTEDMVRQRLINFTEPLDTVTKINLTGRDLTDISVLRRMTSLEVISLSVNRISTLKDFQYCKNLRELHVRRNEITDLNELYYLTDLQFLKILGLSQNPCSMEKNYRMSVIKNLTKLEQLDDVPVTTEERVQALKLGRRVYNPMSIEHMIPEAMDETDMSFGERESKCLSRSHDVPLVYVQEAENERSGVGASPVPGLGNKLKAVPRRKSPIQLIYSHDQQAPAYNVDPNVDKPRPPDHVEPVHAAHEADGGGMAHPDRCFPVPANRESNVLSGIMVLVNELDYKSLETLSYTIKNRLSQFHKMDYHR